MTSVLIADDQALVRVGLRKILESDPALTVVGEAGDGEDAVRQVGRLAPEIVIVPADAISDAGSVSVHLPGQSPSVTEPPGPVAVIMVLGVEPDV